MTQHRNLLPDRGLAGRLATFDAREPWHHVAEQGRYRIVDADGRVFGSANWEREARLFSSVPWILRGIEHALAELIPGHLRMELTEAHARAVGTRIDPFTPEPKSLVELEADVATASAECGPHILRSQQAQLAGEPVTPAELADYRAAFLRLAEAVRALNAYLEGRP